MACRSRFSGLIFLGGDRAAFQDRAPDENWPELLCGRASRDADPLGLDLQPTLYICYELHYRGFDEENDQSWEWNARQAAGAAFRQFEQTRSSRTVCREVGDIGHP